MSSWDTFDCPATERRWQVLATRQIEVEDVGTPSRGWPKAVNDWAQIIGSKASKYQVPAYWIAAIMALESGGRPGLCARRSDGSCNTREGIGLMAMLLSTAAAMAGRSVSTRELLQDFDLQIDLGAKLIADLGAKYHGDYVKMAVAYNAGSVRCREGSSGNTWNLPKEPCPPTPWGVVMGCLRTAKPFNKLCAPSEIKPKRFVCPNDYPTVAIGTYNAALRAGWDTFGLGDPRDLPDIGPSLDETPTPPAEQELGIAALVPLGAAAIAGYYGYNYVRGRLRR